MKTKSTSRSRRNTAGQPPATPHDSPSPLRVRFQGVAYVWGRVERIKAALRTRDSRIVLSARSQGRCKLGFCADLSVEEAAALALKLEHAQTVSRQLCGQFLETYPASEACQAPTKSDNFHAHFEPTFSAQVLARVCFSDDELTVALRAGNATVNLTLTGTQVGALLFYLREAISAAREFGL